MYGLPQAGLLATKLLARRLANYGYFQANHTPCLWKHTWQPIQFALVVDSFGVEYENKTDAQHLLDALNNHYWSRFQRSERSTILWHQTHLGL
jgi:hypothetical protein